jgi:protease YdgD
MRLAPRTACRPFRRSATAGALCRAALLAALAVTAAVGGPAQAGSRLMLPEAQQAEWLAVGRLNVSGQGYCTATLIAPDLVMTAGHCVVDRRTGRPVDAGRVHFLAGFRAGTYAAHGIGRTVAIVPGFDRAAADVARDLALVRLDAPIAARVRPIPVAPALDPALPVTIASYGIDRAQILSTESGCSIRLRSGTLIHTSCEGLPGVSGAPVLQRIDGRLAAVAVASAVLADRKQPVARGALLASEATGDRLLLLGAATGGASGAVFSMAGPDTTAAAPSPTALREPPLN